MQDNDGAAHDPPARPMDFPLHFWAPLIKKAVIFSDNRFLRFVYLWHDVLSGAEANDGWRLIELALFFRERPQIIKLLQR